MSKVIESGKARDVVGKNGYWLVNVGEPGTIIKGKHYRSTNEVNIGDFIDIVHLDNGTFEVVQKTGSNCTDGECGKCDNCIIDPLPQEILVAVTTVTDGICESCLGEDIHENFTYCPYCGRRICDTPSCEAPQK